MHCQLFDWFTELILSYQPSYQCLTANGKIRRVFNFIVNFPPVINDSSVRKYGCKQQISQAIKKIQGQMGNAIPETTRNAKILIRNSVTQSLVGL